MHSMVTEANKIVLEIFLRKLILSVLTTHTHKVTWGNEVSMNLTMVIISQIYTYIPF